MKKATVRKLPDAPGTADPVMEMVAVAGGEATNVYSVEIEIAATLYVRATSPEKAMEVARGLTQTGIEVAEQDGGGHDGDAPAISGKQFADPTLPDVSLSPSMTILGPDKDEEAELAE